MMEVPVRLLYQLLVGLVFQKTNPAITTTTTITAKMTTSTTTSTTTTTTASTTTPIFYL